MKYNVTEFRDNDKLLARVLSGPIPDGTHFHTKDNEFIQVATMKYDEGHHMKSHKHNVYSREFTRTCEVFIVSKGRVKATLFNEDNEVVEYILLGSGDIAIFFAGGHCFDVIDADTEIIEIKNGPYFGVEKDKTFFKHDADD